MQENQAKLLKERLSEESYQKLIALENPRLHEFVADAVELCQPDSVVVVDDSTEAAATTRAKATEAGEETPLTIEGHTDSTGSAELNDHLSQLRAESVKQYLLANSVLKANQVASAGYGSSRPLAPNTTAKGRAANRRIDVVITPRGMHQ